MKECQLKIDDAVFLNWVRSALTIAGSKDVRLIKNVKKSFWDKLEFNSGKNDSCGNDPTEKNRQKMKSALLPIATKFGTQEVDRFSQLQG